MKLIETLCAKVKTVAQQEMMPFFLNTERLRKADGSALSQADVAVQTALSHELMRIIDVPVLGEEMAAAEQRHLWSFANDGLWVIDPIDGTNNFINGIPHFAVSVAFVVQGRTQMGVIYNPVSNECFYAVHGAGAFLNGQKLPLRHVAKKLREAIAGVEIRRLRSARLSNSINHFAPFGTLRCMGSSTLDWCYLAAGRYDVYVHGGQNLWDYAAGALILEEAGGEMATLEGDDFWSGQHVFQRSVIAAGQESLFRAWLSWVRQNQ